MSSICIVDLDGVVCDNTRRFEKAEEAKQAALVDRSIQLGERQKTATQRFWDTAFTPGLVALDTLIEGAIDALADIAFSGFDIVTLTSRPESMREATRQWLFDRGYPVDEPLIMKAPAFQTVTWKAGMVQTLAALYEAENVLFVDDEQANRTAVMDSYLDGSIELIVASSLAEALEKLKEDEE